ncbi:hypothetical protein AXG93_328s1020 [Marchantia polymorpha subsp. ruderalis]|uniref:Uncharacterized protein n=1 Tax=Marchantia polymorpha subsp. ruderalis TaxID=1480154 RepID=A0A176VP07_MARPO|nr:hypothetical protein AXG93_328s1020 [Marchantia polymorpha subsp. ruderalis]
MVERVETRGASRKKEVPVKKLKRDKKDAKRKELKSKELPPRIRFLRRRNIKDEVGELLPEELEKTPPQPEKRKETLTAKAPSRAARVSRTTVAPKDTHYDIATNFYDRQAHITFRQLIEDNNFYRKLMSSALKRVERSRTHKLPRVYQVRTEDLGPPEIDIEIGGCTIWKTRRKPLGTLKDVRTTIGGVVFPLNYVIIKPLTERGYKVLIGRPWFYGAKVRSDWHKRSLQFKDPNNKAGPKITVPWDKIPHEGETTSTSSGYTSEEETTTSESDTDVHYMEFYAVDEEDAEVAEPEEAGPEDSK